MAPIGDSNQGKKMEPCCNCKTTFTFVDYGHHLLTPLGQENSALFGPVGQALDALLQSQLQVTNAVTVVGTTAF